MKLHIGTSGFSYPFWKERFYPKGLAASKWLEHYGGIFNTVEINHTFYRFPREATMKKYAAAVPDGFRFAVKMHRIVTHRRRFADVREKIGEFMKILHDGLGEKLGPVLYQFPATLRFSDEKLMQIVDDLKGNVHNVVEFRDASWWNEKVYRTLRRNKISFCNSSYPSLPDTAISTGIFYKRMHGIQKLFASSYGSAELRKLASEIPKRKEVWVFFNNTMYEAGYSNALELEKLVRRK